MSTASSSNSKDTPVEKIYVGKVLALSLVASLGGFLFGNVSSVINGANKAVFYEFQVDNGFMQGFVVAIALLGSALGAYLGGGIVNRHGHKRVMLLAGVLFLVAGIGTAFPLFGVYDFMFWRVISGIAIGLAAVVSPMYISEVAPAHVRGRMGSLFQLAIVVGIFSTQVVNQVLLNLVPDTSLKPIGDKGVPAVVANNTLWLGVEAWQWMFLFMVIPTLLYIFLARMLPESPRYLVAEGRSDEARVVMSTIYVDISDEKVSAIQAALDSEHKHSMKDIRGNRLGLKPLLWAGIIIAVLQQVVGINAVFYYSNLIWGAVGFGETRAFGTSTIISAVNVIFTLVAISLIDRVGRKPLLLVGSIGMFLSLGLLTLLFQTAPKCTQVIIDGGGQSGCTVAADMNNPLLGASEGWVAVAGMNVFVAFFAATWGPITWVLLAEMFPSNMRAAAMSIAVMANWLANFVVSMSFPGLVQISLGLAYGLFTIGAFVSFFYVWKYVKETKGVELEAIAKVEGVSND
jgi:sugar porter (SP) family MFS transporter